MSARKKDIETQVKKMVADFQERNIDTSSVRVFVTYNGEGNTYSFSYGGGDYYAQIGYVSDWLEIQRARSWHQATQGEREDEAETF